MHETRLCIKRKALERLPSVHVVYVRHEPVALLKQNLYFRISVSYQLHLQSIYFKVSKSAFALTF